ncbi:glycerate dehydrogenase [Caballeronia arvi]|uniref:Glycerate dehydrogenase n=1 Tax=Caballeronia arvi TaxID=1777135 RepID=A0A158KZU9_9BURK|nr:hypothetical protein [Caballeronia arvi]SAL86515.1 glycerate dehydrogenase [Caballeronia arvi]
MKTIVFLDRATLSADLPDFPFPHRWVEYSSTTPGQVVERCSDAQIVVTNKVPLTGDVLAQLPHLELIGVPAGVIIWIWKHAADVASKWSRVRDIRRSPCRRTRSH